MKLWEIWLSHVSTLLVTVSGGAYLWMKFMMTSEDPFSVVNHPWQPAMLALHVISAPLLVFVSGLIVRSHIQRKLQGGSRANRRTGLLSTFALPLMIVSGYMLQVVTAEWLASLALVLHLASSTVFAVTYAVHQVTSFRLSRKGAFSEGKGIWVRKRQAA